MSNIFISYARIDEPFARRLAKSLSDLAADVWIDVEDIPAGVRWSSAIQQGLDICEAMVVILSPELMASKNVEDEWQYYLDQRKPIIPVLIRRTKVHYQLARVQYVNFEKQSYETAFHQLADQLIRKGIKLNYQSPFDTSEVLASQPPLPATDQVASKIDRPAGRISMWEKATPVDANEESARWKGRQEAGQGAEQTAAPATPAQQAAAATPAAPAPAAPVPPPPLVEVGIDTAPKRSEVIPAPIATDAVERPAPPVGEARRSSLPIIIVAVVLLVVVGGALLALLGGGGGENSAAATETRQALIAAQNPTSTPTETEAPTLTATASPTPTTEPSPTPTEAPTETEAPTLTPTIEPTATGVPLPSSTVLRPVYLRTGPGNQFIRQVPLSGGVPVTVMGRDRLDIWRLISTDDGRVGWVTEDFLGPVSGTLPVINQAAYFSVTRGSASAYAEPSRENAVATLNAVVHVPVVAQMEIDGEAWYEVITAGGRSAWVAGGDGTLTETGNRIPVTEVPTAESGA